MSVDSGAMHVARNRRSYVAKSGERKVYESVLLRRSYREAGKVKHETLANLKALPDEAVAAIEATLKGTSLVPGDEAMAIGRSLPHGHVAAIAVMATKLDLPGLLGPPCRARDLALALIYARIAQPESKLSTLGSWADTTLGADLGLAGASTDEIYAAMDWLFDQQEAIEAGLARRHLAGEVNPARIAMFDLSSSWVEGRHCPLAERGYSRDGKKGKAQIEYGLLTDPDGRPVAVRVFPGSTADPTAFTDAVEVVAEKFGLERVVLVGDRGMITSARIAALREHHRDYDWITALRAPAISALAADDGPLQLSLFDEHDLAEITHPDYPGERLIACRNPALADERVRKRHELLDATEKLLTGIADRVHSGRLSGADVIGVAVGQVINRYKVGKHFTYHITDSSLAIERNHDRIAAEAALDGIYVIRTSVDVDTLDAPGVVTAYKNLSRVERDFRSLKTDDLDLRPIYHRLEDRVKAHVLLCMLACYLTWHLRRAWAELTYTDEHRPAREDPVAAAQRSPQAQAKASRQHDTDGSSYRSFTGLLQHLATLTRNHVRFTATDTEIPILAEATPTQRRAFQLIGAPIPLHLT